jgi:CheY-like chemotaxis protein
MATEAANDFSNVRILVVDDHESMRLIISTLLRAFGFTTISEAVNGDDALRITPIFEPDLVITDLRMPVRDGMALVQSLRQDAESRFQNVPVIMVTGHASESVIRNAIAVGVNQFLAKPITGRSLAERIRRAAA